MDENRINRTPLPQLKLTSRKTLVEMLEWYFMQWSEQEDRIAELGRRFTAEEVSRYVDLPVSQVREIFAYVHKSEASAKD